MHALQRFFWSQSFFWSLGVVALLLPVGCRSQSQRGLPDSTSRPLRVLVAASTAEAMHDLAAEFQRTTGATVEIIPGASNALAQQIVAGAPADLYLAASPRWSDELQQRQLAAQTTVVAENRLVLVTPADNPAQVQIPQDLLLPAVQRLALAGENVPAGQYADQALQALQLAAPLADLGKIVRGQDVRYTVRFVEQGEAEAGIVYATDVQHSGRVQIVHVFDAELHDPIVYPLVLLQQPSTHPQAQALFDFLTGADASAIFQRHGFLPAAQSSPVAESP